MKKESAPHLVKMDNPTPHQKLVPSSNPDDDSMLMAQQLFRQGNLPQAELYARRSLAGNGENYSESSRLLDEIRQAYGLPESFELAERENRYFLIKAWGYGFWSEGHHLVTQLLLAELTQRTPIVLWGPNFLFRKELDVNAFGHFLQKISLARLEDIPRTATIFPSKWHWNNLHEENINKWTGEGSRMAAQYFFDRPETLLVSDFYSTLSSIMPWIGRNSKYYGLSEDAIYAELFQKYIRPVPRITAKVDEFHLRHMQGRPWVGIHIRGSDKIHESPNLALTNASYLSFINRIIELNPTIGIFLLTDSIPLKEEFSTRYGNRILCTQATRDASNTGVHLSGHDGIKIGEEVLLDSLLALKCDYFIGNKESNVSLAISSMRNWPKGFMYLLGNDNVRGENPFLHKEHSRPQNEFNATTPAPLSATIIKERAVSRKRVIQTFKAPQQWINSPPGLGDFIRGACHLFEALQSTGIELRIDISQTEFSSLIDQEPSIFQRGDEIRIANAEEYFVDHIALQNRLASFMTSDETDLYICTNLGAWNRLTLPENVKGFIRNFYRFTDKVEHMVKQSLQKTEYEVLSLRCGDLFYSDPTSKVSDDVMQMICTIIEQKILPNTRFPLVVTSDSHEVKCAIAKRYGMLMLPHQSQHGAFGNALPVALDLCMLKNSQFNYHINSWATWWSGFSHYTSIIFNIPGMNFRAPLFAKEEITALGLAI